MTSLIDRRLNAKGKSTVNRQRFMRRYKNQIKTSVSNAVTKRSVTDVESGESVIIPSKDIKEPIFHQGSGGTRERVFPGNDQFVKGDKIERPPSQEGSGGKGEASDQGEGQDDFAFQLSKEEYLDILFEDLELPNLQKNQLNKIKQYKTYRAGFTNAGSVSNLNIVRSFQSSIARRMVMSSQKRKKLKVLQAEHDELINIPGSPIEKINLLADEIADIQKRIKAIPFLDTFDLKYNNFMKRPVPISQAVMFCLMDVSGSMDQATKDMAKRFYILLYLFLTRTYENLEVIFIRHHTQAKEVSEHEFFYSQETGGTIVSSALKMMYEIQKERYPSDQWNVYVAQASDGDNWADDSPNCKSILHEQILPFVRYYSYIEITNRAHQTLWREYEILAQNNPHFVLQHIRDVNDIYPVFRELFKKQTGT
tara:strand:+ start:5916 stop:7184 length:1269 start_codon:yes stop_codon:yes gene_type:complete